MRDYFARHGALCPPNVNPAEYMLEAIGAGISPRIGDRDWKDIWLDSQEFARTKAELEEIKQDALTRSHSSGTKRLTCRFSKYSPISLLNCASRCDAALVPTEGSCAAECALVVEIARIHFHTTLLTFNSGPLRDIALSTTRA